MSFIHGLIKSKDPIGKNLPDPAWQLLKPKTPPPPPGVPNSNDALNASQSTTDAMRMRRGLMANIYGGASNTQPVSGTTTLGT